MSIHPIKTDSPEINREHTDEKNHTVLVVDDDQGMREVLWSILDEKYQVLLASSGEEAIHLIDSHNVQVVFLDIGLPGMSGMEVLEWIRSRYQDVEVIMITVLQEVDLAVKTIKLGAFDFVTKDFDYDRISSLVERALDKLCKEKQLAYLSSEVDHYAPSDFIYGNTPIIREIYDLVDRVAGLPATILITGESGTGKELLARYIHRKSNRSSGPFVTVDLSSIPADLLESTLFGHEKGAFTGAYRQRFGKFELGHGGSLFLDEIGELRLDLQSKLLRIIQEGQVERLGASRTIRVDARLIIATNRNLESLVRKGEFREDLFYRINIIPMRLPPLRERINDLPTLVDFFIRKYSRQYQKEIRKIADEALEILMQCQWKGNIRELENLINRLIATLDGPTIFAEDIPIEYQVLERHPDNNPLGGKEYLRQACEIFEKKLILKTLEQTGWSNQRASAHLDIPLSTLKYKIKRFQLHDIIRAKRFREKVS